MSNYLLFFQRRFDFCFLDRLEGFFGHTYGSGFLGRAITLRIGQELTLNLESNPSTGYRWFLANTESSVLISVGKSAFKQGRPMPGAGGVESWTFRAAEGGNETLKFEYRRAWETNMPPARKVLFHVKVRSAKE